MKFSTEEFFTVKFLTFTFEKINSTVKIYFFIFFTGKFLTAKTIIFTDKISKLTVKYIKFNFY